MAVEIARRASDFQADDGGSIPLTRSKPEVTVPQR
jgi:hypothetical protein